MSSNAVRSLFHDREGIRVQWEQLGYFRSVARLEHISQAAHELGITQPALSRAIARLEREIGAELFERRGRSISLTRYGTLFLRHVERALDAIETGRRDVLELASADAALVSLGFLRTLGAAFVPQLVRSFTAGHPNVRFAFAQNNGAALEAMLLAGEVAMTLTVGPPTHPALRWERVMSQRLVLIVPPDHRLASRTAVKLTDLRDETFLSFKPGHAVRDFTDDLCRRVGFTPHIAFEADESNSIRGFVNAGFGIALVPQTGTVDDVPSIRIADADAQREVGIAWLADRTLSEAEAAFQTFVVRSGVIAP
jgi:DNA-binding transcriptional LysR family regulator